MRIQGTFFLIDEVRRFRRPFEFDDTETRNLVRLTGSLKKRFQHIDKFAVEPDEGIVTTVAMTYRGVDVTGLQYAHTWTSSNANILAPNELDINSFGREDLITVAVTTTGDVTIWFSGEEYTLVEYPAGKVPPRFVCVVPYGFSRVVTAAEFEEADMAARLRT